MATVSEMFVVSLEGYFGPWRGDAVKAEIAAWLDEHNLPRPVLQEIRETLIRTRKIGPVNTIGIADLAEALDHAFDRSRRLPAIEGPTDALPRDIGARKLREILEGLLLRVRP